MPILWPVVTVEGAEDNATQTRLLPRVEWNALEASNENNLVVAGAKVEWVNLQETDSALDHLGVSGCDARKTSIGSQLEHG